MNTYEKESTKLKRCFANVGRQMLKYSERAGSDPKYITSEFDKAYEALIALNITFANSSTLCDTDATEMVTDFMHDHVSCVSGSDKEVSLYIGPCIADISSYYTLSGFTVLIQSDNYVSLGKKVTVNAPKVTAGHFKDTTGSVEIGIFIFPVSKHYFKTLRGILRSNGAKFSVGGRPKNSH